MDTLNMFYDPRFTIGGPAMVETTHNDTELRKDVDALKESCQRTEKTIEDMRNMLAKLIENQQHSPPHVNDGFRLSGDVVPNWEYIKALNDRFGQLVYDDPMSEVVNLKQVGNVQYYLDKFDELVNCLELPDQYALREEDIEESIEGIDSEVVEEQFEDTPSSESHISMHVITGLHDFKTMRVTGWLVTLGDINWNFSQLKMEFTAGHKTIVLRGMQPSSIKLISRNKMTKLIQKPSQAAMLHVGLFHNTKRDESTTPHLFNF
ncbi:hypothetical protein BUALT_Bualt05G0085100 [Buddleja alternifolia]|uniref:Retrotransposon gag domain-containing protein n=1 Tax=Buddleja alternifolia TaxID=168488 RepID=A0AAV6XJK6_9LAMI|nr:hypothetical protein BUALT_Bualt05G0085100 [Buddleja alternifolia]